MRKVFFPDTSTPVDAFGKGENMASGKKIKKFLKEEDGVTVIEIILVLVVLISLVLLFKKQLTSLVNTLLSKVTSQSNSV